MTLEAPASLSNVAGLASFFSSGAGYGNHHPSGTASPPSRPPHGTSAASGLRRSGTVQEGKNGPARSVGAEGGNGDARSATTDQLPIAPRSVDGRGVMMALRRTMSQPSTQSGDGGAAAAGDVIPLEEGMLSSALARAESDAELPKSSAEGSSPTGTSLGGVEHPLSHVSSFTELADELSVGRPSSAPAREAHGGINLSSPRSLAKSRGKGAEITCRALRILGRIEGLSLF